MRGLIATTALAATALLLAGCEKKVDPAANDSASSTLSVPTNEVDPDVDDNSFGVPELGPGNVVQNSEDPAVNAAADR